MAILTRARVAPPDVVRQAKATMALLVRAARSCELHGVRA